MNIKPKNIYNLQITISEELRNFLLEKAKISGNIFMTTIARYYLMKGILSEKQETKEPKEVLKQ